MHIKRTPYLFVASVILMLFIIGPVAGLNLLSFENAKSKSSERIDLTGNRKPAGPFRSPHTPSLVLFQTDNILTIYFLNDLGSVDIVIADETGVIVYNATEPSSKEGSALIDLCGLDSGGYTITLTNADSLYMHGYFEL